MPNANAANYPRQHLPGGQSDQHAARHTHPQRHLLPAGGAGGLRALRPHRLHPARHPAGQQVSSRGKAMVLVFIYYKHIYYLHIDNCILFVMRYFLLKKFFKSNPC